MISQSDAGCHWCHIAHTHTHTPFFPPGDPVIPEPDCRQAGGNPGSRHATPRPFLWFGAGRPKGLEQRVGIPDSRLPGGSRAPG
jgi:hypothetical protein